MQRSTTAGLWFLCRSTILTLLALLAPRPAAAQQVCLTPTQSAKVNISWFLHAPENKPWRDSLGITARYVSELQSLTDADSMLCRRMDSTIVDKPVYYYRAGNYIIASNAPDSSGRGRLQSEWDVTTFVFDSLGHPVPRSLQASCDDAIDRASSHAREVVAREPSGNAAVRNVATCLRKHFAEPMVDERLDASTITIANLCARRFRIHNAGPRKVILTFEVMGRPGKTRVYASVGDSYISTEGPGVVRLHHGGQLVASASSSATQCPVEHH